MKFPFLGFSVVSALLVPTAALSLAACGSSSDSPAASAGASSGGSGNAGSGNSAGSVGAAGAGDPSKLVGSFLVKLAAKTETADANATVLGKVYDAPTPANLVWETAQTDGDCKLLTPRVPYCSTPCGSGAVCVEDDTCVADPTSHSVGTVTVTGLRTTAGASSFTMTAIKNAYQPSGDTTLAYPPFAEGDAVTFAAAGGDFAAFSLTSKGVTPLEVTSTALELKSGVPIALTWTKGGLSDAKIHVKLDISHHGGTKGQIECDTDDSGSLTISAALVGKLLDLGVAGFPSVIVTRHTIGSTVISPGLVELEIASLVEQFVAVDGLTSCTEDTQCADGQTCQDDLTCK